MQKVVLRKKNMNTTSTLTDLWGGGGSVALKVKVVLKTGRVVLTPKSLCRFAHTDKKKSPPKLVLKLRQALAVYQNRLPFYSLKALKLI